MRKKLMALLLGVMIMVSVIPQNVSAQTAGAVTEKTVQFQEYESNGIAKVTKLKCGIVTPYSINISWKQVSGVSGYEILRADSKNGPYRNIMNVAAGNGSFCNRSVTAGTEYYYKVRAYVKRGGKIATGKASKVLTAHTKLARAASGRTRVNSNLRKSAGVNGAYVTTLVKGTAVSVICATKDKSGVKWYKVSTKSGKKKLTGYMRSDLIQL